MASQSSPLLASSSRHFRRCSTSRRHFELVGTHIVSGRFAGIVIMLYHPGSAAVLQSFFDELATVLDRVSTYLEPVYVVGDYNIPLDHPDDPHAIQLRQLLESYGLLLHNTCSTHQLGGTLDAVVTRADSCCPEQVDVFNVGLSDHHLLQWSVDATCQPPPTTVTYCRAWRRLDYNDFWATLSLSRLSTSILLWPDDLVEMATVYDVELTHLLDQLIPACQVVRQSHHSDPWFNSECCHAKRLECGFERRYAAVCRRATDGAEVNAAKTAWYDQCRAYRKLHQWKCTTFWSERIDADRADPQKLWR